MHGAGHARDDRMRSVAPPRASDCSRSAGIVATASVQAGRRTASARRRLLAAAALAALALPLLPAAPVEAAASQVQGMEYWLDDYGVREAWGATRGAGVTVAVIDTGVDGSHPDLAGAVVGGTDVSGVGGPTGQTPLGSDSAHGTMVASLLAGRGQPGGRGVLGVAPEADLLAVSVGFEDGEVDSDTQIAEAVTWAVDNGADIINLSLTRNTLDWPESWDDAFLHAAENDVVVIAAAGNRGAGTTIVGAPATMPGVLTVAGVDRRGEASFDASSQGITIGVSAPSEQLVGASPGGGYVTWQGTSGATPLVSGVAALVRSAHPELDAANVIERIVATADPVGAELPSPLYGYGLLRAGDAVSAPVAAVEANRMGDLAEWVRVHRRAAVDDPGEATSGVEGPAPLPSMVPRAAADSPEGVWLPSAAQLREVGIPLALLLGFGLAAIALVITAAREAAGLRKAPKMVRVRREVPDPVEFESPPRPE